MCEENDKIAVEDSLNRMYIEQLHNATLNFSKTSLEIKKLCVTVEITSVTLIVGLYQNDKIDSLYSMLSYSTLMIAVLFYFVDIVLYYYQDKLRAMMIDEENKIRLRHGLQIKSFGRDAVFKGRVRRSITNCSQIIYWILIGVSMLCIILKFIKMCFWG